MTGAAWHLKLTTIYGLESQKSPGYLQGINLCDKWLDVCTKLTSIFWPGYSPHRWEGGSFSPDQSVHFGARLREILSLRSLHKQLTQLLSNNEQEELRVNRSFEPFAGLNPIQVKYFIYYYYLSKSTSTRICIVR